jgi:hypothetical protein
MKSTSLHRSLDRRSRKLPRFNQSLLQRHHNDLTRARRGKYNERSTHVYPSWSALAASLSDRAWKRSCASLCFRRIAARVWTIPAFSAGYIRHHRGGPTLPKTLPHSLFCLKQRSLFSRRPQRSQRLARDQKCADRPRRDCKKIEGTPYATRRTNLAFCCWHLKTLRLSCPYRLGLSKY